jgi:hypothetical protein
MFKFALTFVLICFTALLNAQSKDTLPPYLQVPYVPPFKILLTDSTYFAKDDLPSKKPVVIIYLSPDCGHCQIQTKDLVDSMHLVKNVFFVLTTYKPIPEVAAFEADYGLKKLTNIKIGRDTKYFLPSFYKVKFTPFVAVYNKKGNLLKAFENGFSIKVLQELLD